MGDGAGPGDDAGTPRDLLTSHPHEPAPARPRESPHECGTLDVDQGDRWRETDPEVFDCFDDALRNVGEAELAVVHPTVEGDPIRVWYRLTGDAMEVYEDAGADSYGGDTTWLFRACGIPERIPRKGHPDCP